MRFPNLIDNRNENENLKSIIKKTLKRAINAYFATGYFYLNGFNLIKEDLESIKLFKLLIGDETDYITKQEITEGYKIREFLSNSLIKEINRIPENNPQQIRIKDLHDFIAFNHNVDIKIYTASKFHSKAYIIEREDENNELEKIGIIGSSNFTKPGFVGNTELNTVLTSEPAVIDLMKWFDIVWAEAEPYREDLLKIIRNSALFIRVHDPNYLPPFELFKKIMFFYLNEHVLKIDDILTEFQQIGVENVIDKIHEYNGAIVADSVGLGKSFIGGEVIQRYNKEERKVLCIVPASIVDQWKEILIDKFMLTESDSLQIISHEQFSRMNETEILKFRDIDLILIDEAHRFRNKGPDIKRSNSIELLKGTHFLLLTATPLNNSIQDLQNLISIFVPTNRLLSKNLDPNAFERFKKILKSERNGIILDTNSLKEKEDCLSQIGAILEETMLLRTRSAIKMMYPNLKIQGKKIEFRNPEIRQIEYNIAKDLFNIPEINFKTDFISDFINSLFLPHIFFASGKNGATIGALYRILLLKRLESSIYAFMQSLYNLKNSESEFLMELNVKPLEEIIQNKKKIVELDFRAIKEDIDLDMYVEKEEEKLNLINEIDEGINTQNIISQLKSDIEKVDLLINNFKTILQDPLNPFSIKDDKLVTLIELIEKIPFEKILIFTQFRDTVDFLRYHLEQYFPHKIISSLKGGQKDKNTIVKRFSPNSNNCIVNDEMVIEQIKNRYGKEIDQGLGAEINILIATDTLSEGVNLQDCDYVINYDLPWNPTRIIQRVGRVDRIGSNEQKYVYNFKTDQLIESLLGLMEKLESKVEQIALIIGREYGILSEKETPNIKTIGEQIKKVQTSHSMEELEQNAINALFKDLKFGERKDSENRLELRQIIKNLQLIDLDFYAYSKQKGGYCFIKESKSTINKRNFLFVYYKIYDKNNNHSLKDVILKIDEENLIYEISPIELKVEIKTEGLTKDMVFDKISYETKKNSIDQYFYSEIYLPFKAKFTSGLKHERIFSKIQQEIRARLWDLKKQHRINESMKLSRKDLNELYTLFTQVSFKRKDAIYLKNEFNGINVKEIELPLFLEIVQRFKKEIINQKAEYQESITLEKDIKYEEICWGQFI